MISKLRKASPNNLEMFGVCTPFLLQGTTINLKDDSDRKQYMLPLWHHEKPFVAVVTHEVRLPHIVSFVLFMRGSFFNTAYLLYRNKYLTHEKYATASRC